MGKFERNGLVDPAQEEQKKKPYKDWELPDIIQWCQENNQIEWLKEAANRTISRPVYPKKKVARMDENGNPILTKKGKQSYTTILDKEAEPIGTEESPISFVELKSDFLHTFKLCEPKKAKGPNFIDKINAL